MSHPMPRPRRALLTLVPSILAAAAALADEAPDWLRPDQVVVVTASREPETLDRTLAPVTIIDRDDIERSLALDVGQLLGAQPGIDITPYGGPGQTVSVFTRGTNSNHTVFLVDGIRINPGTIGVAAIQNIAPDLIDHVEIVKGPRSAIYGTDAIGGVVSIVTRSPEASGGSALAGYGRYQTREAAGDLALNGEAGSIALATRWLESDGFPVLAGDTARAGYRNLSESLIARTTIGGVGLVAHAWNASGNTQYSEFGTPTDENFRNSIAAVEASGNVAKGWHMLLRVGRMRDDLLQTAPDPYAPSPIPTADYETTHRTTVDWQNSLTLGRHSVTAGALWMDERTRALVFGTQFDEGTRATTLYVQDRFTVGAHHVAAALGRTHHSTFGDHGTYNVEYGYESAPGTMWTAGIGTAFRAPDSTARFGYGANPALRPETSRNVELGVRHRIGPHASVSLTAFDNHIENLIAFAYTDAAPFGINENIDHARIQGAEATWQYTGDAWRARLGLAHQEPVSGTSGTRLLRRSRWNGSASVERIQGAHELGLDVRTVGARPDTIYDADFNPVAVTLGGYTLVAATWRWALGGGFTLQAKVDNLLDKRYEYISGYNTMRRSVFGAVRYDFR